MIQKLIAVFLLIELSLILTGCAPAKYRGWDDGDMYFEKSSRSYSSSSSSSGHCTNPYVVRSGDTLSVIAQRCGVNMYQLADRNNLVPPYRLFVKQELVIPSGNTRSTQAMPTSKDQKTAFSWPVKTKLKYEYVPDRAGINGLVIYGKPGENVYAVEAGHVVYAGNGIAHYGNMVIIKHDNEYLTVYAHNQTLRVREGMRVEKRQLVATLGKTGSVTKPQLYLEARYRGRKVDVEKLFSQ